MSKLYSCDKEVINKGNKMERLVLCSKVLYDIDIIEKQKRILDLEKQLQTPKLSFKHWNEWTEKCDLLNINIKKILHECIVDDERQYYFMFSFGITPVQESKIDWCVYKELYKLTDDTRWSRTITDQILLGVSAMFCSFISSESWIIIYESLDSIQLCNMIYKNIVYQLDIILEDIPQFKCIKCKNADEVCSECN